MKYILETKPEYEDTTKGIMVLGAKDSNLFVDTVAVEDLEELNSDYINEHFGSLQDDAYKRGLEDGKKAFDLLDAERDSEYQRGLDDAWECARKLFSSMADSDIEKAFPTEWNNGGFNALINLQPQEAIAKLKAYEKKQKADDKIKVGDVVRLCRHKVPYIVTSCDGDDDTYILMTINGGFIKAEKYNVRKTGRHFDIQGILEAMKA